VSIQVYFLATAVMLLFVSLLVTRSGLRRQGDGEGYEVHGDGETSFKGDSLVAELSARIFCPEDSEFVASQSCANVARTFQLERRLLAMEWLRGVRQQVNRVFRFHLKAARQNPDIAPLGELRLGIDFLAFQLAAALLYAVIRVRGPLGAARLVHVSLGLSEKFLGLAKDIVPLGSTTVGIELLDLDRDTNQRRAAR
jgi:hypothetical protein